jgi:hypothetical protein
MPRALPQLIKPAPTLAFRDRQQGLKLVPLVFIRQAGQTLSGPACCAVTDARDETRQRGHARQQYLALEEPLRG